MDNTNKALIAILVVALGAITYLGMTFPKYSGFVGSAATSTSGSYYTNAKWAGIVFQPLSATSTSILNTDGVDRIITDVTYSCSSLTTVNGAPLTSTGWLLSAATTSGSAAGLGANTNYVLLSTNSVATTTAELYVATTSPGLTGVTTDYRRWGTGSYLTFNFNASSTASCVLGAHYIND